MQVGVTVVLQCRSLLFQTTPRYITLIQWLLYTVHFSNEQVIKICIPCQAFEWRTTGQTRKRARKQEEDEDEEKEAREGADRVAAKNGNNFVTARDQYVML